LILEDQSKETNTPRISDKTNTPSKKVLTEVNSVSDVEDEIKEMSFAININNTSPITKREYGEEEDEDDIK
jgi:hypothetical protein